MEMLAFCFRSVSLVLAYAILLPATVLTVPYSFESSLNISLTIVTITKLQ